MPGLWKGSWASRVERQLLLPALAFVARSANATGWNGRGSGIDALLLFPAKGQQHLTLIFARGELLRDLFRVTGEVEIETQLQGISPYRVNAVRGLPLFTIHNPREKLSLHHSWLPTHVQFVRAFEGIH